MPASCRQPALLERHFPLTGNRRIIAIVQAYGGDRLRVRDDGTVMLSCRVPKEGWQPRTARSLTTPEHPGTAVQWDDDCWEVVSLEATPSGVRYTLAPWPEGAAMRFVDHYSEVAEAQRVEARQRAQAREHGRKAATLLGFLTGHLPARVQRELASELGINPQRLTMISAIPPFVALIACVLLMTGNVLRAAGAESGAIHRIPMWVVVLLGYLGVESIIRLLFALTGKPMGSLLGLLSYSVYYGLARDRSRLVAPLSIERGSSIRTAPLSDEQKLQSDLTVIEPLFSLLDERDQKTVAERFGIDYRTNASTVALIVLIFSMLGVITSFGAILHLRFTGMTSFALASVLFAEQLWRLSKLQQGPAPSILRFVIRPFLTRYLD